MRFRRVCAAVASGSLPTSLQTCLLSTLREGVLPHLLQEVCGTPDAECMALFQGGLPGDGGAAGGSRRRRHGLGGWLECVTVQWRRSWLRLWMDAHCAMWV